MGKFVTTKIKDNVTVNFSDAFQEMEADLQASIRGAASSFFRECVTGTPVDTGYARSRWSVDLVDDTRELDPKLLTSAEANLPSSETKKVLRGGSVQEIAKSLGEVTYGSAEEVIQKHLPRINRLGNKNLKGLNVTNDAPYIGKLEQGHSEQNKYWIRAAAKRLAGKIGFSQRGR